MVVEARKGCSIVLVLLVVSAAGTLGPALYEWETHPGESVRVDLSWVTDPRMLTEADLHSAAANLASAAFATSPNGNECFNRLFEFFSSRNVSDFRHIRIPRCVVHRVASCAFRFFFNLLRQRYRRQGMQILQSAYERNSIELIHHLSTYDVKCSVSAGDTYKSKVTEAMKDTGGRPVAAGLREPSSDDDPLWHVELYQRSHDIGSARKIDVSYLRHIGAWSNEGAFKANVKLIRLLFVLVEHGFQLVTRVTASDQVTIELSLELDIAEAVDLDRVWQVKLLSHLARIGARMTNVLEALIMSPAGRIGSALYLMKKYHMRPSFDPTYIERLMNMGGRDRIRRAKLVLRYGGYTATLPNGMSPKDLAMEIRDDDLANLFEAYDGHAAYAVMFDMYVNYH